MADTQVDTTPRKPGRFMATLGVLGFCLSLVNSWCQYTQHDQNVYEENSIRYKPQLEITDLKFRLAIRGDTAMLDMSDSIPTIVLRFKYDTARVKVHFTNVGDSHARLAGFAVADSSNTSALLRTISRDVGTSALVETWEPKYEEFSVGPGKRDSVELELIITRNPGETGVFHFLLLYENQRGVLFDTYYWMPYRIGNMDSSEIVKMPPKGGKIYHYAESTEKLTNIILDIQDRRADYRVYTKDESDQFRTFVSKRMPKRIDSQQKGAP